MKIIVGAVYALVMLVMVFMMVCMFGCSTPPVTQSVKPEASVVVPGPLSWENGHPERQAWTLALIGEIGAKFDGLEAAKDLNYFCPKFPTMTPGFQIAALAELFIGMAKFESGWKPATAFRECRKDKCIYKECIKNTTYGYCMKGDSRFDDGMITSRGLLQMSIRSSQSYGCDLKDPKELHDPIKNLKCATTIMVKQIKRTGMISSSSNYWSVVKSSYSKNHLGEIRSLIQKYVPECK